MTDTLPPSKEAGRVGREAHGCHAHRRVLLAVDLLTSLPGRD